MKQNNLQTRKLPPTQESSGVLQLHHTEEAHVVFFFSIFDPKNNENDEMEVKC